MKSILCEEYIRITKEGKT